MAERVINSVLTISGSIDDRVSKGTFNGVLVAVKEIHTQRFPSSISFEQLQKLVDVSKHPNIIEILDIVSQDTSLFVVMEVIDRETFQTLQSVVTKGKGLLAGDALDIDSLCEIIPQFASGLDHFHRNDVLHGDVTPDNAFFSREKKQLKIGDLEPQIPGEGIIQGTIKFMAPEQAAGKGVTASSDIFGFGATCYYLLTGKGLASELDSNPEAAGDPFFALLLRGSSDEERYLGIQDDDLLSQTGIDKSQIDAIFRKVLSQKPEDRYSSAGEFAQALVTELRKG